MSKTIHNWDEFLALLEDAGAEIRVDGAMTGPITYYANGNISDLLIALDGVNSDD